MGKKLRNQASLPIEEQLDTINEMSPANIQNMTQSITASLLNAIKNGNEEQQYKAIKIITQNTRLLTTTKL